MVLRSEFVKIHRFYCKNGLTGLVSSSHHPVGLRKMRKKNLESIDLWKGIAILSVLNIHTVFWSGRLYLPDWTRSLALMLDVPVFIFISGFLLQNSRAKVVGKRILRQFGRLLTDYVVVAILALVLAVVLYAIFRFETDQEIHAAVLSAVKLYPSESFYEIFQVLPGSMWYLHVYLSILPLGILILASPLKRWLVYLPFAVFGIFLLTTMNSSLDQPFLLTDTRHASFYLAIFLAGAAFKVAREKLSFSGLALIWGLFIIATLGVILWAGELPDLQEAKFPPSPLYLLFTIHSILPLCLLVLYEIRNSLPDFMQSVRAFLSWCGRHTFRIYLWQGVAASIPFLFVPPMLDAEIPPGLIFVFVLVWNILASLGLTYLHNRFLSTGKLFSRSFRTFDRAV